MKLYYLANIRYPTEKAHGLQIRAMCREFERAGYKVELIIAKRRGNKVDDGIREVGAIDFIAWDWLLGSVAYWFSAFQFLLCVAWLKVTTVDAIYYTREPWLAILPGVVVEMHNLPGVKKRGVVKQLLLWSKMVVAITAGLKDDIVSLGVPEDKVVVAHDGVDPIAFAVSEPMGELRERLKLPSGIVCTYSGSVAMYSWKGVDIFLQAAQSLPHMTFLIVGGSEEEINNLKLSGISDNVICAGYKPHDQIKFYLAASDILVLPNKSDSDHSARYTSPLKLFEYMAAGKSMVASQIPAIEEVLTNSECVYVTPGSPQSLTFGISLLAEKPELRASLGLAAREKVKYFSWRARAEFIINKCFNHA